MPRLSVLQAIACLVLIAGFGVKNAWREIDRLLRWHPVQATVMSADVERDDSTSSEYRAVVIYRYRATDGAHDAAGVMILPELSLGDRDQANAIVTQYPVGSTVVAYVNPDDPGVGFLDRRIDWGPLCLVFIPFSVGAVLLSVSRTMRTADRLLSPPPAGTAAGTR
ncbi:MAG TPA: DUF3592 domain-containing protein [Gemmatimonadaceae bacterium]|nr:DUF3592 domain-containing protein [Gemmatimonadaceae bacterium]